LQVIYVPVFRFDQILPWWRVPYAFPNSTLITPFADPDRATHYEASVGGELLSFLTFRATYYGKSLRNQLQLGRVYSRTTDQALFVSLLNSGAGTVRGFETEIQMRIGEAITVSGSYGLTDARGRSSHPRSNAYAVTDDLRPSYYPEVAVPLDYAIDHKVVLLGSLQAPASEVGILGGAGLTVLLTYSTGHPYSRFAPVRISGAASPWNIGVRSLIDPRAADPIEPENSSRTPGVLNVDIHLRKSFSVGGITTTIHADILNVFNVKSVLNVYPNSGLPNNDSWFESPFSSFFKETDGYEDFYNTINLRNRWHYMSATGNDIYGTPRQIRLGLRVDL
ncbi:MAG: hypothetical protein WD295_02430, partial [Bacteroidota bacterium]